MICKYCGTEYEPKGHGRLRTYCFKDECRKKAMCEASRKYYKKQRNKSITAKNKDIYRPLLKPIKERTIVYSKKDSEETKIQMPDTGDILELARSLGTIRYQLVQKIQAEQEVVGKYDKLDQDFLHKLESLEELTDEEALELIRKEKKNRESRRIYKVRYYLIKSLLDAISMKNPCQFIAQAIQRSKNYEYVPRVIDDLKNDETFYSKKEN